MYQNPFEALLSIVLGIPTSRIAKSYGNSMFNVLSNGHAVSTAAVPFSIPTVNAQGSNFSTSSPTLVLSCHYCFVIAALRGVRCA